MTKQDASFGTWLKKRRKTLDMTQDELAKDVGCATITIRKIESNALRPSIQIATRLSECCHIPEDEQDAFIRFARSEDEGSHIWVDRNPGGTQTVRFESDRPANNLVATSTPLIGRTSDLEVVMRRLKDEAVQLLTIVGPPGVGKTRFATEIAHQLIDRFRDGVFIVALSPITDTEQALVEIAQTIGTKETGMRSITDDLKSYLYDKEMLLVLDNLEQVRDIALPLERILQTCFGIKILATSREALRLRRERRYTLNPLEISKLTNHNDLQSIRAIPAVTLFIERAQAVNNAWQLTAENASDVVAVCQQLNGLPLSIELIAARSTLLSPRAMTQQLTNQLAVLTSRSFDHPQRQRTLRDAIGWSVQLLEPEERELFSYLGVFPQQGSLRALEAICQETDLAFTVLDSLTALADKSLVQTQPSANEDVRFDMLQVLREYARKQLNSQAHAAMIHQRHAEYYHQRAKTLFDQLSLGQQNELFDRLHQDIFNYRAAFEWFLEHQITGAMQLVASLSDYWFNRGQISEGRRWINQMLQQAESQTATIPDEIWIHTLNAAGFLAYNQNDYQRSTEYFSRSLTLIEKTDNPMISGRVYNNLGLIAQWRGEYELAETRLKKSLMLWTGINFHYGIANVNGNLGGLYVEYGDHKRAEPYLKQSLELWQNLNVERGIGSVKLQQAKVAFLQGDLDQAAAEIVISHDLAVESSNTNNLGFTIYYQGLIALHQQRYQQARDYFEGAYAISQDLGSKHLASLALLGQGRLALYNKELSQSERAFSQSIEYAETMEYPLGCALGASGLALVSLARNDSSQAQYILQTHIRQLIESNQYYGLTLLLEILALALSQQSYLVQAIQCAGHAQFLRATYQLPRLVLEQNLWQQVCTSMQTEPEAQESTATHLLNLLNSIE